MLPNALSPRSKPEPPASGPGGGLAAPGGYHQSNQSGTPLVGNAGRPGGSDALKWSNGGDPAGGDPAHMGVGADIEVVTPSDMRLR